jgi:flagellar biosynthesis/type III secretory pathway protein FliH
MEPHDKRSRHSAIPTALEEGKEKETQKGIKGGRKEGVLEAARNLKRTGLMQEKIKKMHDTTEATGPFTRMNGPS